MLDVVLEEVLYRHELRDHAALDVKRATPPDGAVGVDVTGEGRVRPLTRLVRPRRYDIEVRDEKNRLERSVRALPRVQKAQICDDVAS